MAIIQQYAVGSIMEELTCCRVRTARVSLARGNKPAVGWSEARKNPPAVGLNQGSCWREITSGNKPWDQVFKDLRAVGLNPVRPVSGG